MRRCVRMAKVKAEFALGELLTFSGLLDAAVRLIDHYSRWEVLVSLEKHLGFFASPMTPFILLLAGLILIHRSMQQRAAELIQQASNAQLRDADGNPIVCAVKMPSVGVTVIVAICALMTACLYAILWIMNYEPPPAPMIANTFISSPHICKTAD